MRIRSIKPEFWRSDDIAGLAVEDRLLFIGLWSYVDDNGVGPDRLALIAADLFAADLERDPRETFARVSRGLSNLSEAGLIVRYEVQNRAFLEVVNWSKHQRIDKPNKARFPQYDASRDTLATSSRDPREILAPGTGDQGTGDQVSSASADAEREPDPRYDTAQTRRRDRERYDEFDEWYSHYPRKRGKGQAMKAYRAARKKADAQTLLAAIQAQAPKLMEKGPEFCPYPATWLNGERWEDQPDTARPSSTVPDQQRITEQWRYR